MYLLSSSLRSLLSQEELNKLQGVLENDEGVVKHGFNRDDGHGRQSRLCLWNHPGNDVTGMLARCEKVAGTMEKVSYSVIVRLAFCAAVRWGSLPLPH